MSKKFGYDGRTYRPTEWLVVIVHNGKYDRIRGPDLSKYEPKARQKMKESFLE